MSTLETIQDAMEKAVALINEIGTSATYLHKATGNVKTLKIMARELGNLELVGDYRQGDLKVECDATKLDSKPKKYDTIVFNNETYSVRSPNSASRMVGDTVYTYKFVVRGA